MVQFAKLKLSGFKSFVDKCEMDIAPGLNGIVGPNGCGKSNLVEALRWVMGGSSAKSFRTGTGSSMEDVIFAGTAKRPARNAANVQLLLDNSALTAPAPFHTAPEIVIERQIQRDKGSTYRVNGKTVRARDVQTLFADSLTGANSPALVSQGRITKIIEAKPIERRSMLEESAGVAGLFTRRREAELRLKAAQENLERAEDQNHHLRQNLTTLKRQAKQAERYRQLGEDIRSLDLAILWHHYQSSRKRLDQITAQFETAEKKVQETMLAAKQAQSVLGKKQATLPKARDDYAAAQAAEQKARLEYQRLVDHEEAEKKRLEDHKARLIQLNQDQQTGTEEASRLERLLNDDKINLESIETALSPLLADITQRQSVIEAKQAELSTCEQTYEREEQQRLALVREQERYDALTAQLETATAAKAALEKQHHALEGELKSYGDDASLLHNIDSLKAQIDVLKTQKQVAKEDSAHTYTKAQDQEVATRILQKKIDDKEIENNDLSDKINAKSEEMDSVAPTLTFAPEYAASIQAMMGEDGLNAGLSDAMPSYWDNIARDVDTLNPALDPMANYVEGPQALQTLFQQTALVDTYDNALALKDKLKAGQAIVTLDGDIIRFDGLHMRIAARQQGQAGFLIEQKTRLQNATHALEALKQELSSAQKMLDECNAQVAEHAKKAAVLQNQIDDAHKQLSSLQNEQQAASYNRKSSETRLQDIKNRLDQQTQDVTDLQDKISKVKQNIASASAGQTATGSDREAIIALRQSIDQLRSDKHIAENSLNAQRDEVQRLKARIEAQQNMLSHTRSRLHETNNRLASLQKQKEPSQSVNAGDNETKKRNLAATLDSLSAKASDLREMIAQMEIGEREASHIARDTDSALSDAREARALLSAELANATEQFKGLHADIHENYAFTPQQLEQTVIQSFADQVPTPDALKQQREQFIHRRESIGAVNLRAEEEAAQLETELAETDKDMHELAEAITQLHQGIAKLNKEARARMVEAFDNANKHFQDLFTRLFNGGEAHLKWVDSDDPLMGGIDIQAQPPGKSLQSLSLLSGGEQTLTATALIFGMFLSSPSPICVLDEIDAPLDDSNVERICDLLEHLARTSHTRFLIITHHRMTMARMDRLYGVTMAENGVSKLVSVDLNDQRQMSLLSDDETLSSSTAAQSA